MSRSLSTQGAAAAGPANPGCGHGCCLVPGLDGQPDKLERAPPEGLIAQSTVIQNEGVGDTRPRRAFVVPAAVPAGPAKLSEVRELNLCPFAAFKGKAGISVENHAGVENQRRCFAGTNGLFFGQSGKRISCSYSSGISHWHRRNSGCTTAASIASSPRRGWEAEDGKPGTAL